MRLPVGAQAQRAQALRSRLIGDLHDCGDLPDREWTCAVAAVAREVFLPRFYLPAGMPGLWRPVEATDRRWLDLVYRDAARVLSLSDPAAPAQAVPHGLAVGTPRTVAMAPGLAVYLLHALGEHPSPRTLHAGDDPYLTALLLARYGLGWVDTVVDPDRAAQSADALAEAGYPIGLPMPDRDRLGTRVYRQILAPSPVPAIPAGWLEAAQPGAVIVTAIRGGLHSPLVRLVVADDQTAAVGAVLPDTRQLPTTDRCQPINVAAAVARAAEKGIRRSNDIPPGALGDPAMRMLAGLLIPDMSAATGWVDGAPRLWLADSSGATVDLHVDRGLVIEAGRRRLWRRVERIYRRWTGWGWPSRNRFGITATPLGVRLWLDKPTNEVADL